MKKILLTILMIFTLLCSQTAFADKAYNLAGSGVKSISLPDSSVSATQEKAEEGLTKLIGADEKAIIQDMENNNMYLVSFDSIDNQPIQYTISSTDNAGINGGSINSLSETKLNNVKASIKTMLEGIGYTVSNEKLEIIGNNKFFLVSGNLTDSGSGKKLYCETYATIQYDKLILLRVLNYSGEEFTSNQLSQLKDIASSIVFEQAPVKSENNTTATNKEPTKTSEANAESNVTEASTESVEQSKTETSKNDNSIKAETSKNNEKSYTWLIVASILAVILVAVIIILIKRTKNLNKRK